MASTSTKATKQSTANIEQKSAVAAADTPEGDGFGVFMIAPITMIVITVLIIVVSM